ncbi:MAG: helix-hairpin-helix domain-containing protein [Myxococcota bacterium]
MLSRLGRGLALSALLLGAAWPMTARAVEYEVFVDVDDEEDLNELLLTEQVSETTYETLVELMRRGTDLNRASREDLYALPNLTYDEVDAILAYRDDAGRIADPADLVVANVISRRKLAAIASFLLVPDAKGSRGAVHGLVRYRMTYVAQDPRVPPMALQARVRAFGNLTVGGAAVLEPQLLAPVRWDPNRAALVAEGDQVRPRVPKLFAQWETDRWGVIAGTYRIGFGQRLTFDNSRRYTPNGFYLDDALIARYDLTRLCRESAGELRVSPCDDDDRRVAPSFRFSPGLTGVAGGAKKLPLPVGWFQAYGFWSMQTHDLYQYRIYERDRCEDPRSDDASCESPALYNPTEGTLDPSSRHVFRTLPRTVDLITQGANLGWYNDSRTHVGVTGYGTIPRWRIDGAALDFKPAERFPRGGAFGAVGADFSWGYRWADVFGEVSRSFDGTDPSQGGGGGFAGILRHTASWNDQELEVSARYYDSRYSNPYSRPISARDRFEGNQARDEAGGRVRYTALLAQKVSLRTFADFWVRPSTLEPRTRVYARADVDATKWWRPGLWLEYQNNDLGRPNFTDCRDVSIEAGDVLGLPDEAIICGGQRVQLTARSRFAPIRRLYFTLQYRHEFQNSLFADTQFSRSGATDDDIDFETFDIFDEADLARLQANNRLRQDTNAFVQVVAKPIDPLRLRARVRWFWEDITDNSRLEHSVWTYFEAQYKIRPWAVPMIRYSIFAYVDRRDSTATRSPNPEHWIALQFQSRF